MAHGEDAVRVYLDRLAEEDPTTATLVAAYESNEELIQALIAVRQQAAIAQRELAKRMDTSQSVVVHLEAGQSDPRLSTIARYAAALGKVVHWRLQDYRARPEVSGASWLPITSSNYLEPSAGMFPGWVSQSGAGLAYAGLPEIASARPVPTSPATALNPQAA